MRTWQWFSILLARAASVLLFLSAAVCAQQHDAPKGIASERELPSRYPYVVQDILRHCNPAKGFWVDLGAGKGPVALELVRATGNPVVMVDPDVQAMQQGLEIARGEGLADRLFAVVGVAERLPFPDGSVDLVASRGSIFFWDDPAKGLQEVYRVLRPGGKAYIGGGAGSGYPKWAVEKLIADRRAGLEGDDAEKWKRFVELRRPEQMRRWAEQAGLSQFQVLGQGAISAADPRTGQGVWLLLTKPEAPDRSAGEALPSAQSLQSTGLRMLGKMFHRLQQPQL